MHDSSTIEVVSVIFVVMVDSLHFFSELSSSYMRSSSFVGILCFEFEFCRKALIVCWISDSMCLKLLCWEFFCSSFFVEWWVEVNFVIVLSLALRYSVSQFSISFVDDGIFYNSYQFSVLLSFVIYILNGLFVHFFALGDFCVSIWWCFCRFCMNLCWIRLCLF